MKVIVPFADVVAEWQPVRAKALEGIDRVFSHGRFVGGPEIAELEQKLAGITGARFAVACASGTTALQMAMMALGIGPGDEVIVPDFTFIAPAESALVLGAEPVLVDVLRPSGLLDPDELETAISSRTKAIVAVSLFGLPANFEAINSIASRHGIPVIEDAAQSLGAGLEDRRSGNLAGLGCTSFFPTKVLGGAGDGGAVFTNDEALASALREIRDHGQGGKYHHLRLGMNGRMSSIAAAALLARLDRFSRALDRRRSIGALYDRLLEPLRETGRLDYVRSPDMAGSARSQYAVVLEDREALARGLREAGIETAVHYPAPLHDQPVLQHCRRSGRLETASMLAKRILCLPIHPGLADEQVNLTVERLGALVQA